MIPGDDPKKCFVCNSYDNIQRHHIFEGSSRNASERWDMVVHLCMDHHTGFNGVHSARGNELRVQLHKIGQTEFEEQRIAEGMTPEEARELFIEEFIRSYL